VTATAPDDAGLLEALRREGLHTVAGAFAYGGGADLPKANLGHRQRTRVVLRDDAGRTHELFMKRYGREPWGRRLRRRLRYGAGVGPAAVEFANVRAARAAGVATMEEVACGEESDSRGVARGYVIVKAVPGAPLERCAGEFLSAHAADAGAERLTAALAALARTLHRAGYVHRDLYASHVFLDTSAGGVALYLIDLARMFRPRWRRFRWRAKDLAQLKYSMPEAWAAAWWERFLRAYLGEEGERLARRLDRAVSRKVDWMQRQRARREGRAAGG
jgi:tRNA A-37 threonylcarbamoyl transferase component Bud32